MLKKFISILAVFSLVSVSATVPVNNFKQAVDDFNFAVTVEWDQQDKLFYNNAVEDFKNSIQVLSDEGMTNQEIIQGVVASVKNKKQAAELQRMVLLLRSEQMTENEVINFITEKVRLTQEEGASFAGGNNGNGLGMLLVVGMLVGIGIYLIHDRNDDEEEDDHGCRDWHHGGHNGHQGDDYGSDWLMDSGKSSFEGISSWNECMTY